MKSAAGTSKAAERIRLAWDPDILPPFPAIALQALNLMAGTDTSLLRLCNLIRPDPAFSTAVLKIANSPLVAFSKEVTSVLQASMLLGFRRLKSVVITVGLKAYLQNSLTPLMQSCWRHSVACAMIAERTAKWSSWDKDFAYTAGILHDLGRVALATVMPQAYAGVVERGIDRPEDALQSEQELCGIDHCQAGSALVSAWNLPEAFMAVVSSHHNPATLMTGAASTVRPSCMLADALGFTVVPCRSPRSYAEIRTEFSELARSHFPADPSELASEIADEIKVIESA
jgi:putative nucleotidyltransferase with HDIG domain